MTDLTFEEFKDSCIEDLSELQEEFIRVFDIHAYPNYYYDDGTGIFEFKSDSKNLYFRYVKVGTFSRNTDTFKWSWDNDYVLEKVKTAMAGVKAYGETNHYTPLTSGLLEGDEYTGWALTAIATKLLHGIGAYRIISDHLEVYFVFTSEVDADRYAEIKEMYVHCGEHGSRRRAFVCTHLFEGNDQGFHEPEPSYPDVDQEGDYEGWCDACETIRQREGEWTDAAMKEANLRLVCVQCFFEIKERNMRS